MICKLFPVFSRRPSNNRFQMKASNWCRCQEQGRRRGKRGICWTSFAQWRYSKQWSNRELLLLLVENYTQYPAQQVWKTTCWGNFWRLWWEQIVVKRTICPLSPVSPVQLPELNKSTSLDGFTLVLARICLLTKQLQLVPFLPVVSFCFTR